ncbi:MAG TPA: N,N-dimethylformamidase beta subunit family domain-containing protein [Acidimicrobiales bacterium]|nr:N,N-dimethylformamidase beta subunit family domain-containing protein [Acidimicrobiales bacterium]
MGHEQSGGARYEGRHFRRRRGPRPAFVGGVALAVAAIVAGAMVLVGSDRSKPLAEAPAPGGAAGSVAATGSAGKGAGSQAPPASADLASQGAAGVTSAAIVAENARPGTDAWRITPATGTGFIEGFADTTYAQAGQTVNLYVSTSAASFQVVAYRMGWYAGLGGREVWRSASTAGVEQPSCPVDHRTNMVSCDSWSQSVAVAITSDFLQGDYLLKLVGSGGEQSYIPLTIWDPGSRAAFLVMARSLTEQGWNTYGGYSYYQGKGPCILGQTGSYPPCNRARVVSFDRPYDSGNGASDFLENEYPLVQLMEKQGLDAAYCTDVTVDEHPSVVMAHRALLSLGHDETWTYNERKAAVDGLDHGVNLVFFGAAPVLRHSRLESSALGPDRQQVDYRDESEDPLDHRTDPMNVTGNTWSSPPAGQSPVGLVGEEYSGYLNGIATVPFVVTDSSSWVYDGTGLSDGSEIPSVVGSDFDHLAPYAGSPADTQVLGHSPVPLSESFTMEGKWGSDTYSDMTYYTDPKSQAGVLDTGTVNWIDVLVPCAVQQDCAAPAVSAITLNILKAFGQGPAGQTHPAVPNWRSIRPLGS